VRRLVRFRLHHARDRAGESRDRRATVRIDFHRPDDLAAGLGIAG